MESKIIRLRVKTNSQINMIVAIQVHKQMQQLAHRVLNCFHELAQQYMNSPPKRRYITVSSLKINNYFIAKSQIVGHLLKDNDQIQCTITKAQPKYPKCPHAYENSLKKYNQQCNARNNFTSSKELQHKNNSIEVVNIQDQKISSRRKKRKDKRRYKRIQKEIKQSKTINQQINKQQAQHKVNIKTVVQKQNQQNNQHYKKQHQQQKYLHNHEQHNCQKQLHKQDKLNVNDQQNKFDVIQIRNNLSNAFANVKQQKLLNQISDRKSQQKIKQNQSNKKQIIEIIENNKQLQPPMIMQSNLNQKQTPIKNKMSSIIQILSKRQQKDKKIRKKNNKSNEKLEESISITQSKSNQKQKYPKNQTPTNLQKPQTIQKQISPTNKVASPKVTFHSSPSSPQIINLNSPKRKGITTSIQKIQKLELQASNDIKSPQKLKKGSHLIKLQHPTDNRIQNITISIPSIIIQQQSQGQPPQKYPTQQQKQTITSPKQPDNLIINPQIAALDAKLNKYCLELFSQ